MHSRPALGQAQETRSHARHLAHVHWSVGEQVDQLGRQEEAPGAKVGVQNGELPGLERGAHSNSELKLVK